jgi:hypothetical protein
MCLVDVDVEVDVFVNLKSDKSTFISEIKRKYIRNLKGKILFYNQF